MRFAAAWIQERWSDLVPLILTLLGLILAMVPTKVGELEKHRLWKFGLSAVLIFIGIAGTLQSVSKADKAEKDTQQARAEERQAREEQKQAREEQREDAMNNKASQRAMQDKLDKVLGNPNASRQQKLEAATLKQEITDLKTKQDKNLGIRNKLAHFLERYNMLDKNVCAPINIGPAGSGAGITPEKCQELYRKQTDETAHFICESGEMEFADCVEFRETSVPSGHADALKRLIERYRK
jgi:type IV secretory pathway VirB10-like protein